MGICQSMLNQLSHDQNRSGLFFTGLPRTYVVVMVLVVNWTGELVNCQRGSPGYMLYVYIYIYTYVYIYIYKYVTVCPEPCREYVALLVVSWLL